MDDARPPAAHALELPRALRALLLDGSREARPAEACGLLLGTCGPSGWTVERLARARNLSADPGRYEVDPADHLAAQLEARRAGLELLGAWHSHPDGPARPSARDEHEALPGWIYLIVDPQAAQLSAWRLDGEGRLGEIELRTPRGP